MTNCAGPELAMRKVVLNARYGGFGVARGYGPFECDNDCACDSWECRSHPDLIAAIERDGSAAVSGEFAKLVIVEIPAGLDYQIDETDGFETLHNFVPKRGLDAATTARLLEWIRNRYEHE